MRFRQLFRHFRVDEPRFTANPDKNRREPIARFAARTRFLVLHGSVGDSYQATLADSPAFREEPVFYLFSMRASNGLREIMAALGQSS